MNRAIFLTLLILSIVLFVLGYKNVAIKISIVSFTLSILFVMFQYVVSKEELTYLGVGEKLQPSSYQWAEALGGLSVIVGLVSFFVGIILVLWR